MDWRGRRGRWRRDATLLTRLTGLTPTATAALASLWSGCTFGTLDPFWPRRQFLGHCFGADRFGLPIGALAVLSGLAATSAAALTAAPLVGTFNFVALLDFFDPLAAATYRTLLAAAATTATSTALVTTRTSTATLRRARLLGLTYRTTGTTRDTHAERPRTEPKEPALAFLDGCDRGFRALQSKCFKTLADRLILRLAFVHRTFCHGVPCLPYSHRVTKRNVIALGRSLGRIVWSPAARRSCAALPGGEPPARVERAHHRAVS